MSLYVVFRSYGIKNDPHLMYCFLPFSMYNAAVFCLTWSQSDTSRWQGLVDTQLSTPRHPEIILGERGNWKGCPRKHGLWPCIWSIWTPLRKWPASRPSVSRAGSEVPWHHQLSLTRPSLSQSPWSHPHPQPPLLFFKSENISAESSRNWSICSSI